MSLVDHLGELRTRLFRIVLGVTAGAVVGFYFSTPIRNALLDLIPDGTAQTLGPGDGFAITLRPGCTPLITMMAERIHRDFTPAMRYYTRWLTGLWVLYFVAMIGVSFALYLLAPWTWWAFYCSVLTPLAAMLFFVAEYGLRYWRHPEFERVSLAQVVQAWRATGR